MAFGFAGAAAGAAESLDTLLAKRRAEALAQQELEQRRVTEERMRKALRPCRTSQQERPFRRFWRKVYRVPGLVRR